MISHYINFLFYSILFYSILFYYNCYYYYYDNCLYVCLSVSWTTRNSFGRFVMKCCAAVWHDPERNWLHFGGDLDESFAVSWSQSTILTRILRTWKWYFAAYLYQSDFGGDLVQDPDESRVPKSGCDTAGVSSLLCSPGGSTVLADVCAVPTLICQL